MAHNDQPAYRPLDSREKEIRLARVRPLRYNQDQQLDSELVVCQLEHKSCTTEVEYTALSYAWEHGSNKQQIQVDDNVYTYSANLVEALRRLRNDTDDLLLWIDQICINQKDDVEKSYQVQEMKNIYLAATHVVVWLGPSANNSDLIMATFSEVGKHSDYLATNASILSAIVQRLSCTPDHQWDEETILSCLPTAYDQFCRRAYWKRLWVIQEFAVARAISIVCGSYEINFSHFILAWDFFTSRSHSRSIRFWLPDLVVNSPLGLVGKEYECHARSFVDGITTRRREYHSESNQDRDGLFNVMTTNLTLQYDYNHPLCSDPRDRVFSLLGLASDLFPQFPDYTKSTEDIYEGLASAFFRQGHIDCLAFCQHPRRYQDRILASWAPDWSMQIRDSIMGSFTQEKFNASAGRAPGLVLFPDPRTITLEGVYVDSVKSYGSIWDPNWLETIDPLDAIDYLTEIRMFCESSFRFRNRDVEVGLAQIAIADFARSVTTKSKNSILECCQAAYDGFVRREKLPRFSIETDLHDDKTNAWNASYYASLMLRLHSRRPFISNTGYVGLAPSNVAEGDHICILLGGRTAYILRPELSAGSDAYTVVGEAYVHGIMYGEFMKSDPKIGSFALV